MTKYKCGIIHVNRGDTFQLLLDLNVGTSMEPVIPEIKDTDEFYFGVMEPNQIFEDAIVRKLLTKDDIVNNELIIQFNSKDTQYLLPGKYYYQLKHASYENDNCIVTTLVDKTIMHIMD